MSRVFSYISFILGIILVSLGFILSKVFFFIGGFWVLAGVIASFRKEEGKFEFSPDRSSSPEIPPQYQGLSKEVVEELWPEPQGNSEFAKKERQRRKKVLDAIENNQGLKTSSSKWNVKNGKTAGTDAGDFWWYEFQNDLWKIAKQKGEAVWGQNRIYFDISPENATKLSSVFQEIADKFKIPLGYKFLDTQKTHESLKGDSSTRFVANFRNISEAKRFYNELSRNTIYQNTPTDFTADYQGLRLDKKAEFSGGFTEKRTAEENLASGKLIGNLWLYKDKFGAERRLNYSDPTFRKTIQEAINNQKKRPNLKQIWDNA